MIPPPPSSTLFPYTTLFRSHPSGEHLFAASLGPAHEHRNVGCRDLRGSLADRFQDRKSTRLNSSHVSISYAVFCLKKKKNRTSTNCQRLTNISNSRKSSS